VLGAQKKYREVRMVHLRSRFQVLSISKYLYKLEQISAIKAVIFHIIKYF
jgi:hypothetical protein